MTLGGDVVALLGLTDKKDHIGDVFTPGRKTLKSIAFTALQNGELCTKEVSTPARKIQKLDREEVNTLPDENFCMIDVAAIRDLLIDTMDVTGTITKQFLEDCSFQYFDSRCFFHLVDYLQTVCDYLHIDMVSAIRGKMIVNAKKYPVGLCYGSLEKYTKYLEVTKVDETSVLTLMGDINLKEGQHNTNKVLGCEYLQLLLQVLKFSKDRGWDCKDKPRNLLLALVSELGELYQVFLWDDELDYQGKIKRDDLVEDDLGNILEVHRPHREKMFVANEKRNKAAQEIADIMIYTMKLENAIHPRDFEALEAIVDLLENNQIEKKNTRVFNMLPIYVEN
jgi:hypothetical protein